MEASQTKTPKPLLRFVGGILLASGLAYLTGLLLFVGAVEPSGCFFECTEPNLLVGVPLLAGSVGSAAATVTALVWAVIGWDRRCLRKVFSWTLALGMVFLLAGSTL